MAHLGCADPLGVAFSSGIRHFSWETYSSRDGVAPYDPGEEVVASFEDGVGWMRRAEALSDR